MSWLGWFYAGNTVGAVIGCLLAGFWLLRVFVVTTSTLVAVALNAIVAAAAWALARVAPHERVTTGDHREAITEEFRTQWCAALDDAGVACDREVVDGPPADVILATAEATGADLVVVGERGIGAGAASELGSTSRRVLGSATVPVLVVPHAP